MTGLISHPIFSHVINFSKLQTHNCDPCKPLQKSHIYSTFVMFTLNTTIGMGAFWGKDLQLKSKHQGEVPERTSRKVPREALETPQEFPSNFSFNLCTTSTTQFLPTHMSYVLQPYVIEFFITYINSFSINYSHLSLLYHQLISHSLSHLVY